VHITGGDFNEAVDRGVRRAYVDGYLRLSVVADPIRRGNTGDNTPAIIHLRLVPGDRISLTAAPKGFGSENMSTLRMFTPSTPQSEIEDYIVEAVRTAGSNPCPPMVLGVGLGGDFESCALLAKRALCRPVSERNPDPFYREMEDRLLERINALDIGPQGFGGRTTALSVAIETAPTHIAGLPVALNVGCHVTRHAQTIL
jgi:fumarate hydratase subunit alpha